MGIHCYIPNCNNDDKDSSKSISFHEIPGTYERRVAWLREIEKFFPNLRTPERCKVCSDHFQPDSFRTDSKNRTLLKRNAIPTIFQVWVEDYGLPWRRIKKFRNKLKEPECAKNLQPNEESESQVISVQKVSRRKVLSDEGSQPKAIDTQTKNRESIIEFEPQFRPYSIHNENTEIEGEHEEWPDVCVYVSDSEYLEVVPVPEEYQEVSFRDCPVPVPEPESTANPSPDLSDTKAATKQKFKSVFKDFNKQLHNDHLYSLPPGGEIRFRLDAALERVACLEKEVRSLEQSKKRLSHNFNLTVKEVNKYRKMYRDQHQENNRLTTEVQQLNLSLSELNLIKEMAKSSIPLQLARRLVRQKQMSFNHLCDKFTDETREFAQNLFELSPRAFKYVRQQFDNALPHPSIVRKWVNTKNYYAEDILQDASFAGHNFEDEYDDATPSHKRQIKQDFSGRAKRFKEDCENVVTIEDLGTSFDVGVPEFQNADSPKVQHILLSDQNAIPESFIHPSGMYTTVVDLFVTSSK